MSDIYGMRRANGDWFALKDHERMRVPLFHSSHEAMMARLRNFGMLLFEPVAVDAGLLRDIAPEGGSDVDFCLVKDPFVSLSSARLVKPGQLALLIGNHDKDQSVPRNGNGLHVSAVSPPAQSEWWN
jgi:hypothetical protein